MFKKILETIKRKPELLVVAYFFCIAISLALVIEKGVPPDEIFHFDSINYYAQHSADPFVVKQISNFNLGDIARETSYLYHYLLSPISRVSNIFHLDSFFVLRVVNVLIGALTLLVLNNVAIALGIVKKIRVSALFVIASMPMFFFLSSSINYDNAVILLAALTALLGVHLSNKFRLKYVIGLVLIVIFGPLVKFTFLPISLTVVIILMPTLYKNRIIVKDELIRLKNNNPMILTAILTLLIVGSFLFVERYVVNVLSYGTIRPSCTQILTEEECMQNNIYRRSKEFDKSNITTRTLPPPEVYVVQWVRIMISRIYGILAHKNFEGNRVVETTMVITFYAGVIYFIRVFWRDQRSRKHTLILLMFIIYTLALLATNLSGYRKRGIIELAVQGRYWLPVLLPFILYVLSLGKLGERKTTLSNIIVVTVILVSFIFGLPYFISGISSDWIRPEVRDSLGEWL